MINEESVNTEMAIKGRLVVYYNEKPHENAIDFYLVDDSRNHVHANVEIEHLPVSSPGYGIEYGPCLNAYQVTWSKADKGFGPLLYDVAMEYASADAGGLTCDRVVVSEAAYKVWLFYLKNRPEVKILQLDDLKNTLTPTKKDNCTMNSVEYSRAYGGAQPFPQSPLSKIYRKDNMDTIKAFESYGRFRPEESTDAMDRGSLDINPNWDEFSYE